MIRALLLVTVSLAFAGQDAPAPSKPLAGDFAQLQGRWEAKIRTANPNIKMTLVMTIEGDDVTWVTIDKSSDQDHVYTAKLKLDEKATPKAWSMVEFERKGQRAPDMLAIYKLDGDEVTLCTPLRPGDPRPTEFIEDDGQSIPRTLVFKRLSAESKPQTQNDRR
jgi:uncharacterized protein (TIGR03067 family)